MSIEIILHNAKIATNGAPSLVEAIAISDGRVTAIGRDEDILRLRGPATRVIDGHRRTIIPGLNDSHMHPIRGGLNYNMELRWDGVPSLADALSMLKRKSMNVWEDDAARNAVVAAKRQRLIVAGFLTEACVSFPVLSALKDGFEVFAVADACGGLTSASHDYALHRLEQAGARLTSWIRVLLEFQRDWTRHETYEAARAIVVANGGGYGMGLAYAREMIHPT